MVWGGLVKGLFGGRSGKEPEIGPLGLRIGAAVKIEALRFEMLAEQLKFELPTDTLFVTANGRVDLGNDTISLRYYTDEHVMLQILCVGGETDSHIQEVTLYVPLTSYYPEGPEWNEWEGDGGKIGALVHTMEDGTTYKRMWFQEDPDWSSPVRFQERVTDDEGSVNLIAQEAMMYGREIKEGPGFGEYLLLSIEEQETGRSVEAMLGVDLEPGMFRII